MITMMRKKSYFIMMNMDDTTFISTIMNRNKNNNHNNVLHNTGAAAMIRKVTNNLPHKEASQCVPASAYLKKKPSFWFIPWTIVNDKVHQAHAAQSYHAETQGEDGERAYTTLKFLVATSKLSTHEENAEE